MLVLFALLGCPVDPLVCTDLFAFSVTGTVSSSGGEALENVVATYSVDGGASQPCQQSSPTLICGGEESGHFVITAVADGHSEAAVEVDVGADECHVIGEDVGIVLDPIACTADIKPSVIVNLSSDSGTELEGAHVEWADADSDMVPERCSSVSATRWECGEDFVGNVILFADAKYHEERQVTVRVGFDANECHADTEELDIELLMYDC